MHVPLPLLICLAGKAARKSSSLEIRSYVYPQFRLLFFIACAARKEKGIFNISPVFFCLTASRCNENAFYVLAFAFA